jgi:hypothetical protein
MNSALRASPSPAPAEWESINSKQYATISAWVWAMFTKHPHGNQCRVCNDVKKSLSSSSLEYHLKHVHGLEPNVSNKKRKLTTLTTMFAGAGSAKANQTEKLALAWCMSTIPFAAADNAYFKAAFKDSLCTGMKTSKGVRKAVRDLDERLHKITTPQLKGKVTSLQLDGGKSISLNKLLACVAMMDETPILYELFDTNLEILNTPYFCDYFKRVVRELEALGCLVVSVTMEHEASGHAGLRQAVIEIEFCGQLIKLRCILFVLFIASVTYFYLDVVLTPLSLC